MLNLQKAVLLQHEELIVSLVVDTNPNGISTYNPSNHEAIIQLEDLQSFSKHTGQTVAEMLVLY